ncbi:coiled-coil domain-containing protein 70-like [Anser cygnoides]|uniref:coiled-coil domain-containing protein 70-like n=1 Tax=Anser cygnoides TaxID=8845 RepID=UPI0034D2083C
MELSGCPSVGTALGTLQAELGALQAGQAAERGQLERALATARDEAATWQQEATRLRGEVATWQDEAATLRDEAATWQGEATRLRDEVATWQREVATLQEEVAMLRELGARWELEATALRASSRGKEQQWQEATTEVARLREELGRVAEAHRALQHRHRCPGDSQGHRVPTSMEPPPPAPPLGPSPEPPQPAEPGGSQPHSPEEIQAPLGGLGPFLLFVVAATVLVLYPRLRPR